MARSTGALAVQRRVDVRTPDPDSPGDGNRGRGLSNASDGGGSWFRVTTMDKSLIFFKSCSLL